MLLRNIPINSKQTVPPFPWLQAREKEGSLLATELLNTEVSNKFVYSGGFLIYFQESGNWIFVAETMLPISATWIVRNPQYWEKAKRESHLIIKNEKMIEFV